MFVLGVLEPCASGRWKRWSGKREILETRLCAAAGLWVGDGGVAASPAGTMRAWLWWWHHPSLALPGIRDPFCCQELGAGIATELVGALLWNSWWDGRVCALEILVRLAWVCALLWKSWCEGSTL